VRPQTGPIEAISSAWNSGVARSDRPVLQPLARFSRTEEVKDIVHSSERPQQIEIFIVAAQLLDRFDALSNRRQSEIK
jgi:hypothetical protein